MRFIGNKENVLDKIYQIMESRGVLGDSFFDFFSGTTSVARFFKKKNYQVYSSDLLYFSYVLQRAYVVNNTSPTFHKLTEKIEMNVEVLFSEPLDFVVAHLNNLKPLKGFVYNNYTPGGTAHLSQPRMYFTDENGAKIDAVRKKIDDWKKEGLITENEFFILLACLIETVPFYSNIAGVYGAFQKKWDVRALKPLVLRPIVVVINNKDNKSFNSDSATLLKEVVADTFYLDPPYNQRQYAPNYHVLETIAKYDNPKIKGVTGLRDYTNQKSKFCNAKTAIKELDTIVKGASCKNFVLSYNTEGIMDSKKILSTLGKYGDVELVEFDYPRFKSNNNGDSKHKKFIKEQLYILKKNEK